MASRLNLQALLEELLGSDHVYYQPPSSVSMVYPAIVYSRDNIRNEHADNGVYMSKISYSITVIDRNPDSIIVGKVAALPTCRFNRHYESDNLNHDVFTILY